MKTLFAVVTLALLAVATLGMTTPHRAASPSHPSSAEIDAKIDARLHELLLKVNANR